MADEINRTPPKTQAALLEVMQEKQVTIGGQTWPLPSPFYVLATQISLEQEGTYPLPEAQQDRFMLSVAMDYLKEDEEVAVVRRTTGTGKVELNKVIEGKDLSEFIQAVRNVTLPPVLGGYIVDLVAASRPTGSSRTEPMGGTPMPQNTGKMPVPPQKTGKAPGALDFVKQYVAWGAGLRASQNIALAAKSSAAQDGRATVNIADIRKAIVPVLRHRIGLSFRAEVDKVSVEEIIGKLVAQVPAPKS
jgi:MoxR-like ATPase